MRSEYAFILFISSISLLVVSSCGCLLQFRLRRSSASQKRSGRPAETEMVASSSIAEAQFTDDDEQDKRDKSKDGENSLPERVLLTTEVAETAAHDVKKIGTLLTILLCFKRTVRIYLRLNWILIDLVAFPNLSLFGYIIGCMNTDLDQDQMIHRYVIEFQKDKVYFEF